MSDETLKGTQASPSPDTQAKTDSGAGASIFGITKETKSSNVVPIPAPHKLEKPHPLFPSGYYFPIATLVAVQCDPEFEKKDLSKVPILRFIFKTPDGQQYTHMEWTVEKDDEKFELKMNSLNGRIKHIWEETMGKFPESGIGVGATSWADYFNKIASAFNHKTLEDGKAIYARLPVFIKLTYYKSNLQFPLSPNFLERQSKPDAKCKKLSVNPRYDKLTPDEGGASSMPAGLGGGISADDMPDFSSDFN